jgi:hypothetical protein
MTTKANFSEQEWEQVLSGPPMAGMVVAMADGGGMMRETFEMSKVYVETRKQHGKSELLDAIVAAKPERDHTHFHSYDEMKRHSLELLGGAVATLEGKATAEEVDDYRRFILTLSRRVAERHKEEGVQVSPPEQAAIDDIAAALGASAE